MAARRKKALNVDASAAQFVGLILSNDRVRNQVQAVAKLPKAKQPTAFRSLLAEHLNLRPRPTVSEAKQIVRRARTTTRMVRQRLEHHVQQHAALKCLDGYFNDF